MRMTSEIPNHAACVEAVLDGFVECARLLIAAGVVPPFPHDVRNADGSPGIHYQVEPPGEEDWKLPPGQIRDGWADCEDLALWVAAGIREMGEDPWGVLCEDAWVRIVRTGRGKLHAVVERLHEDGTTTFQDPSIELMRPEDRERYTSHGTH
jgi:hypothetical protein